MQTATEIAARVREGKQPAGEAVRACLERIEQLDGELGAFLWVDREGAQRRADAVDQRVAKGETDLPLAGVPVAVKDNICVAGTPTTCGSRILEKFVAPYEAHVAERLRAAGAIVIGKTNLDEFAMGSSTENSALGVTRNPWNRGHVPGGSSGGSAVAVAAGMVPVALGSDTGGSVRQPASFCGVVGLKPTYGRVSRYGLVAFGSSLDQIGPLARTAEDAALVLGAIAGADARDTTCLEAPVPAYADELAAPLAGTRVGIAREYFGEGLSDETRAAVDAAIGILRANGADVVDVHLPHMTYGVACYYLIAPAEASSNLARYDGVHYGHRAAANDIIDMYSASREEGFGAEVKRRIMLGTYALSSGYYDAYYARAMKVRTLLRRDFEHAFKQCDVICSPVTPTTAFAFGEKADDPLAMYLADVYTISANLAGIPAVSVPCGFDGRGLPVGLQIMGKPLAEGKVLSVAHHYQSLTDHHKKVPS
ncbi:MAG: Asp-tRNA(Asn)/Glu-tRNA(Gln) amidotransferase subunit GatA [Phycisphaerales bacterium]|nr:Asp-tRNA(Asn)/Glu-tRNA(Gln) amidotransferase subunit GatA [Phycisphaerales bacterium]